MKNIAASYLELTDRKLILGLLKEYFGRTVLVVLASIATGVLDSVGILTLIPLLALIAPMPSMTGLAGDSISQTAKELIHFVGLEPTLWTILTLIVVVVTLKAVGRIMTMTYINRVRADVAADYRRRLIDRLFKARWEFFVHHPVGHFATSIGLEADKAAGVYQYSASFIATSIHVAIYLLASMLVSWQFTLGAVTLGIVMFVVLHPLIRMTRNVGQRQSSSFRDVTKFLVDGITGLKPLKAMGVEASLTPLLNRFINDIRRNDVADALSKTSLGSAQEPLIALMLCIGFAWLWEQQIYGLSELVVLLLLFQRTSVQIGSLQSAIQVLQTSLAFNRALNSKIGLAEESREALGDEQIPQLQNSIELRDVSFSYGSTVVLDNVTFTIPFGQVTSIQGRSGVGKSTLIDLLAGLLQPSQGRILVDGKEMTRNWLRSWRHQIGYVGQELFLFHTTLRDNILLGQPEDEKLLNWAVEIAGAKEIADGLPNGFDTLVGERGMMLSGGQRQRIALARALVRRPRLLILDEITASLDPKTEKLIIDQLMKLHGEMAIVVISHQPTIGRIADQVIHLEGGGHVTVRRELVPVNGERP